MKNKKPCEIAASITTVACAITKHFTDEEIAILATAFIQLGNTLNSMLAYNKLIEKNLKEESSKKSE